MSSNFNNAKIINVYYNKGDRKPYDVNGKPIAYIGEEAIGATEATTIRFYLGEDLDSSTAVIVTKRPDGERRLDLCAKVGTGANSYYEVTLNAWYGAVKGKATLAFKVYNGSVVFDDNETPTEIISVEGRIVVSDIFNLEIAYAPEADLIVPADDTPDYIEWFAALSTKLDKAQSITVTGALPTLTGGVYDDRYFYVEDEGVGKLWYIDGSTAIEVVFQIGTLKLTSNGNEDEDINVGTNAGKMYWDEDRGTIIAGLYDDQEAGVGDSLFFFGKAVEPIAKGEVVQFFDNLGGNIRFRKAVFAEISAQPDLLMGVAKHAIAKGDFGYVASFGYVRNLNTSAFTTPILYLSTSVNGALSSTKPTTGFKGSIAAVARPSSDGSNDGFIIVRPNLVKGIGELADVTITTATNGDVLSYDGSKWVNSNRLLTAESNITNLQGRMTAEEANVDNLQGRMTSAEGDIDDIESGATVVPRALGDQNGNTINTTYLTQSSASATYIPLTQKAQPNGVATLGADGRVVASQIPGVVTSIEEYDTLEDFPEVGVLTTVYLALDTGLTYLWSGSSYVALSSSLALGETSTTAYRGDRGKEAYDYSQVGHLPLAGGTVTGNLVVGGDLTISGTTTTVNTQEINIKDNLILINSNQTGEPNDSLKGGLEIERGDLTNFQFVFDESDDRFKVGQVGSLQTVATRTDDGTIADRGITFFNTSTNRLENNANIVIDSDNRVGVGTATPISQSKLDVNGSINLAGETGTKIGFAINDAFSADSTTIGHYGLTTAGGSGLWLSGFFGLKLATAGAERMRIAIDGNVGIGLTSPQQKLGISGGIGIASSSKIGAGNNYSGNSSGGFAGFGELELYSGGTGNTTLHNFAHNIDLQTASVSRLFITQGGNVGIGTTSPNGKLGVNGNLNIISGYLTFNNGDIEIAKVTTGAGAGASFKTWNGTLLTEKMLITGDGNVGIGTGTTSPATRLDVNSSVANVISISRNGGADLNTSYQIKQASASWYVGANGTNDFGINTDPDLTTPRLLIKTNGNVGIGTPSPQTKLHINGSGGGMEISPGATTNIEFINRADTNATVNTSFYTRNGFFSFHNGAYNERLRITPSGELGITTTANDTTQVALYVYSTSNANFNTFIYSNGNIVNRNNSYGGLSDIKLKENIIDAKPKLNDLNKVRVVNYNFKNDETKQLGVIAQELEKIFPGMVEETQDKDREGNLLGTTTKSVKYSVFVPMLIKAVQELKEQLDELKAKVG
jgi:hypothetical protein